MSSDIADRIGLVIKDALAVSPIVQGREVYVKLTDLHEVVARLQALKTKARYAEKAAADADAKVCPLSIGDPHTPCVLTQAADQRASDLQLDHDKAVMRLGVSESDAHAMHSILFEMFRGGPVDVALLGNPVVVDELNSRAIEVMEAFEARIQREHEDATDAPPASTAGISAHSAEMNPEQSGVA